MILRSEKGIQIEMSDEFQISTSKLIPDGSLLDAIYSYRARDGKHEYHVSDI